MKVLFAAVVLIVVGAAGTVYLGLYNVAASSPHNAATVWLFETARHASVERQSRGIDIPDLDSDDLKLAGVNDFDVMCASCHGAPGREPQAVGQGMNPPPPDLAESAADRSPAELFWVTKHGVRMTGMPAWGATHDDASLWPVVAFLTALPGLDAAAYDAMLVRAAGHGHHAKAKADVISVADDDVPEAAEPAAHVHDHSGHEH